MKDKTGQEIEVGCVVDYHVNQMLSAFVIEVQEGGMVDVHGRVQEARLVLQIAIPMRLTPGRPAPVYVIRPADKLVAPEPERTM